MQRQDKPCEGWIGPKSIGEKKPSPGSLRIYFQGSAYAA